LVTFTSDSSGTFPTGNSCTLPATGDNKCSVDYKPTGAGSGVHTITATYAGDTDHDGDTGSDTVSVGKRQTQTTVTCGGPAQIGTPITCTAQVDDIESAGTKSPPAGQVDFSSDGSGTFTGDPCNLAPLDADSSSCSVTYTSSAVAVDEINAHYLGSNVHAPSESSTGAMAVFYDPNAGFVTGGGWIMSPPGAYSANPALTGKANFGFVSKYQKGAKVPTGQTEFQFHAGNLNFHSEVYEWLVVAGARAQYKGTGTLNGATGYGFMLTAIDGQISGGGGTDKFRIKIWNSAGVIVYDNKTGASDDFDAALTNTQDIAGGSIVIHSK
jgi:hypothetical protein